MKRCTSCKQALPRHLKELCPLCIELALSNTQSSFSKSTGERLLQKIRGLIRMLSAFFNTH